MFDFLKSPKQEIQEEEQEPYVPAGPIKRALAWMGVVYMLILIGLNTYTLTTGNTLNGIPGIMFAPACFGLCAIAYIKGKELSSKPYKGFALLMGIIGLFNLVLGFHSLLNTLGV